MGKLSSQNLKKLLKCTRKDPRVIVPPMAGFDSGVHLIDGDRYLVVSTDPCIGVPENWFGWLLIHYAASDVALFGAKPEFCTINLLGTSSTKFESFLQVMNQACRSADELGMAITTGHTGTYKDLSKMVGVCTAYGTIDKNKLLTPSGARSGDCVLVTKPIGLEPAVNFALTHKSLAERLFGADHTLKLTKLVNMQSCVKEALLLAESGGVHAMHDATEGGLVSALNEMADASETGFKVQREKICTATEIPILQRYFHLTETQILSMSSTGTIVAAVEPEKIDKVAEILRQNSIEAAILGVFTKNKKRILAEKGKDAEFPLESDDPYDRILSGKL